MLPIAKRLSFMPLVLACGTSLLSAQQPQIHGVDVGVETRQLVSTKAIQDESISLPEDMTALFSNQDRRVRFQVVKLSSDDRQLFANKMISVVNSAGLTQRIKTDSSGYATLENANSGLHAIVVSEDTGHSAIPLSVREVSDDIAKANAKAIRVSLADIAPVEVLAAVRATTAMGAQAAPVPMNEQAVSGAKLSEPFGYSITLTPEGTLKGQIISLQSNPGANPFAGTQISIFKDQALVATAMPDAQGRFEVLKMPAGYYGMLCTGPSGYTAFGFEARGASELAAADQKSGYSLVSTLMTTNQSGSPSLPVVLVPQPMMDDVLRSVEEFYSPPLSNGVTPVTPFGPPPGLGGGLGGGMGGGLGGGAAGGLGGAGGLVGLAAAGGIAAAAIGSSNDNQNNIIPTPRTPGTP